MPDKVITKEAILEHRKSLKLTQEQYGKHLGLSVHTIQAYEQGKYIPNRLLSDPRTAHLAVEVDDNV